MNSFGFGGTNAHAVIDDAYHYLQSNRLAGNHCTVESPPEPETLARTTNGKPYTNGFLETEESPQLLVWSAADEDGPQRLAQAYSKYFISKGRRYNAKILRDAAFTLNTRRTPLPWKAYVVANSAKDLENLEELAIRESSVSPTSKQGLGFIFTGQGAQWFAMGRELMAYAIFKNSLMQADKAVKSLGCEWSIIGKNFAFALRGGIANIINRGALEKSSFVSSERARIQPDTFHCNSGRTCGPIQSPEY